MYVPSSENDHVGGQRAAILKHDALFGEVRYLAATLQPDLPIDDQLTSSDI